MAKKKKIIFETAEQINDAQFVLVRKEEERIFDEAKKGKRSGYYRDVWRRFTKNKGALIAFIVLAILFFFTIFGPFMNKHSRKIHEPLLATMPPKIKGFEKAPFLNGRVVVQKQKIVNLVDYENPNQLRKELLFNSKGKPHTVIYSMEVIDGKVYPGFGDGVINFNGNEIEYSDNTTVTISVDYYKWQHFKNSYYYDNHEYYEQETDKNKKYEKLLEGKDDSASNFNRLKLVSKEEYQNIRKIEEKTKKTIILEFFDVRDISGEIAKRIRFDYDAYIRNVLKIDNRGYIFGTDQDGRDFFTLIWHASRTSIILAISVSLINIVIGIIIGSIAGYYGGTVDIVIERLSEIISGIPFMALLTLLLLKFGKATFGIIILAFTMTGWLGIASLTRAQFYRYKNREYVLAARTMGASDFRIMRKHIFPSAIGTLITSLVLYIPGMIFAESTYSFLGIISYENLESMGNLLSKGQNAMQEYPFLLIFPAIYISILMISFNLMGNGLRDAFNPTLRGSE